MGESKYQPELGQLVFGTWLQYPVPEYAEALISSILKEMGRVLGNLHGLDYSEDKEWVIGSDFEYRPYYWGDDDEKRCRPNLRFENIIVGWYKHPGRGMSTNVVVTPEEWIRWFDNCLLFLRRHEAEILPDLLEVTTEDYKKYIKGG